MVAGGGTGRAGDGAKAGAQKTGSAKKKVGNASAALAEGLREAQREKQARAPAEMAKAQRMLGNMVEKRDPFDDIDSDDETDPLCAACLGKPAAVRKALAAPDVDPDVVGSAGMTPLFQASQDGKSEIVALLLAAKASPGQACFGGATPLYAACARNHADVAKLLLRAGAPVDALANGYYTPLLACVSHGGEDAARALLAAGADVRLMSPKWGTYLHAAAKHGELTLTRTRTPTPTPTLTLTLTLLTLNPNPNQARAAWSSCCWATTLTSRRSTRG